jgi:hypothetical protein
MLIPYKKKSGPFQNDTTNILHQISKLRDEMSDEMRESKLQPQNANS